MAGESEVSKTSLLNDILKEHLEEYLSKLYEAPVQVRSIEEIGKKSAPELKSFGYGKPYKISFECAGTVLSAVLETMSENSFGHDHFSDRAQILLWSHSVSNKLPLHVRSIDVGAFTRNKEMISAGQAEEFFILTEFIGGKEYAGDLYRILETGELRELDLKRCTALAEYLAGIHRKKLQAPQLYTRRIRDLLGHGECIMGLMDNYPQSDPLGTSARLMEFEKRCVEWRWKLKQRSHRLCQVHGDFHPWNILFREETDFTVLDRSRGEWGEPADDVTSMLMNYLFLSWKKEGKLSGPFGQLYKNFWQTYQIHTQDSEMMEVLQPFFVWRALVLGNPTWYPSLAIEIRQKLFHFIDRVLAQDQLNPLDVNLLLD